MRIQFAIPKIEPSYNGVFIGGSVNSLLNLCKALRNRKIKIDIVSSMSLKKKENFNKFKPIDAEFKIFKNNARPQSVFFSVIYLVKCIFWAKKKYSKMSFDLIHGHSGYTAYAWITYLLGHIAGCASIHTLYCPIENKKENKSILAYFLSQSFNKYPLRKLCKVVAMSRNIQHSLLEAGVNKSNTLVIPNGIDTEKYKPSLKSRQKIKNLLKVDKNIKIVLFVGNLLNAKGLDIMLEAMAVLIKKKGEVRLIITTELKHIRFQNRWNKLTSKAKTLGIERYIIYLGIVNFMPQLMAASDIVVAPYRNTFGPSDYPLALMEAMSAGACVVGTAVGGIPELIENNVSGRLVKANDVQDLSEALFELLEKEKIRNKMGKMAREKIIDFYSTDKIAHLYLNLYKKTIREYNLKKVDTRSNNL